MAKKLKIRNDDDKTIFELQLDDNVQNEKVKPGKILLRIFIIVAALGLSILAGYLLQKNILEIINTIIFLRLSIEHFQKPNQFFCRPGSAMS